MAGKSTRQLDDVYLIDAVRTPFGRYRGGLSGVRTDDLAAAPIAALMARHPVLNPLRIDDVILGNTNGAGEENRNVARMALLLAGLPTSVPGATVNRLCGSGTEAVTQAVRQVAVGDGSLVIAGGVEGMSRAPFVLPKPEKGFPQDLTMHSTTVGWRLANPTFPTAWTDSLGGSAEKVARRFDISREEQDAWSARSHSRAAAAWERGSHDGFVEPLAGVTMDECIRPGTTVEVLAGLPAAFTADGEVTAGNSSPLSDGALAALVGDRQAAQDLGVEPLGRILGTATVGVEPDEFAIAPVGAIAKLLDRGGLRHEDIDLWEINEAFAAMVLSALQLMPTVDRELVNPNGGAIAVGHPLGASAPRVLVDLCRELRRRGGGLGVAACCIGVGQGQAMLVEVAAPTRETPIGP
ncbi:thiolase family protein [Ornithinimicrobium faecis]|uniref:thiolase family protein n=1 Tax=Ornithinimicrobium faecis TaxID=2934158 RepID=UPI0022B6B46C|nr:thiolase family protein [Ornithinimicrobium sp. HY1745]